MITTYRIGTALALVLLCTTNASAADSPAPAPAAPDQIVVTARSSSGARLEQLKAINLVNVQGAEAIIKYPDYNAAEALSRIPGVSLSPDTGEGRFVNIRGLDGNLNGATFGGAVLLNTQANATAFNSSGRAVEFDTIPAGSIDRIEVIKTGLPDHEAEGIGGSVELTPRSALTHAGLFVEATLGEGYEPARKTTNLTEEFAIGDSFVDNGHGGKLFHVVVAQNEHNDGRGFDDIEVGNYLDSPGTLASKTEDKIVNGYELRRYRYHRERFGYYTEIDVTPNDRDRYYVRASMAGYQERVNRQRLLITGLDGMTGDTGGTIKVDPANANGFAVTGVTAQNTLRDEKETHRNIALELGAVHDLGKVQLDWSANYLQATYDKPFDYNSTFVGPGSTIANGNANNVNSTTPSFAANYDNITDSTRPLIQVSGVNLADPSLYVLDQIQNSAEYAKDREFSYTLNISLPLGLSADDTFKLGGKLRYRRKYDLVSKRGTYAATGQPLTGFLGDGPFTSFYGAFDIGYAANAPQLAALYQANAAAPSVGTVDAIYGSTINGRGTFDDSEDVTAGYAEYIGHVGIVTVLAGVRVEHTTTGLVGYSTKTSSRYTDVFPTLQLRADFGHGLIGRATYSTGLARPGFVQTIQSGTIDPANNRATLGNPNLVPAYSNNFDASIEYYLGHAGIVALGVFDKEINNYIAPRTFEAPAPAGYTGTYRWTSYANAQGTYVRGIEAEVVAKAGGTRFPLDGLGIDTNVTLADSKVTLTDGAPAARMPGTAPLTANAAVFYEARGVETRLALKYDGRTIFGIGGAPLVYSYATIPTDVYLDHRLTLDWTGAVVVHGPVKFYWSIKNLTNTPLRYFEGAPDRPIQREFYRQTYEAGMRVKF